jgi:hypothetical protein
MESYCDGQNLTFINASDPVAMANKDDKACQVQNKMKDMKRVMSDIKNTVALLGVAAPAAGAPGPSPGPYYAMPAPAPAAPLAPPGIMQPAAPVPAPAPAIPVRVIVGPRPPQPLESRCAMLTELTRQAAERIKAIKTWAEDDGIEENEVTDPQTKARAQYQSMLRRKNARPDNAKKDVGAAHPESAEAKDPDLTFTVKGVISVGKKLDALLKDNNFCSKGPVEDEDDDDDEENDSTVEEDLAKDPAKEEPEEQSEEDEEDEEKDEEVVMQVNETSILDLLAWESDLNIAVDKFEEEVHPHGYKWWRYRYEYTIIESVVLAFSVMVMYGTMWLLHGVSFFQVHKFYKTGLSVRFLRYVWGYFMFHTASLMVMVTIAYMLYIPWGKGNIFDVFAQAFHEFVDGRANVPFLGYSWLYMALDVQFQLFICFALYSLFLYMVVRNYQRALDDWKALSDGEEDQSKLRRANIEEYRCLEALMRKRVQNTPEYRQMFHDLKLRLSGVDGLDKGGAGWNEFKLHLYLTDGLGKSIEYLVEVSLTTNVFLACSALIVAALAHHYQVAFMYFLPGFLVLGAVIFIAGYFICRHFRALSDKDDHTTPAKYVTMHSYCRAIQICLYCLFFSFSRLLLSSDIFEFYPKVYLSALVGLAAVLVCLAFMAGQAIKETSCALILPPHMPQEQFKKHLQQVLYWHTTEKCHECGAQQFPVHASLSREWAGKKPTGERQIIPDSARPYSFRAI